MFLLFLPAFSVLSRALGLGRGDGTALFMAALVWMVAFAVIGYQRGNFRCPRCGELFFQKFDDRSWRMSW